MDNPRGWDLVKEVMKSIWKVGAVDGVRSSKKAPSKVTGEYDDG